MAAHDPVLSGEDDEAITLRCTKCPANARFLKSDPGVAAVEGGGYTVDPALQDKWLGVDCTAE